MAAVTFGVLLFSSSTRGVYSLLIEPLMKEFGWTRGVTTIPTSVNIFVFGLMGPFAAALTVRYGLRKVAMGALGTVGSGALLSTLTNRPWQLTMTWGVVMGVGMGCLGSMLATNVASTWFVAKRGAVVGALMAATTAGTLIFIPINERLTKRFSWKAVCMLIGCATFACIPLLFAKFRNRPEDIGLRAYGAPEGYETPNKPKNPVRLAFQGLTDAAHAGMFWLLFGGFFVCGVTTTGLVQTHWFSATEDHGFSRGTASTLLVVIGVCDLVGSIGAGWLTDRINPRTLLFAFYGLRGLSLFALENVLSLGSGNIVTIVVLVFYGLDWIATVPPTIALANQLFGVQRGPIVYGWLFAAHQLGGALAAWLAAQSRDWTGSFRLAYMVGGALCLVAAVGSYRIPNPDKPAGHIDVTSAAGKRNRRTVRA
jgi:predicted MFS family arabinose efflux permease